MLLSGISISDQIEDIPAYWNFFPRKVDQRIKIKENSMVPQSHTIKSKYFPYVFRLMYNPAANSPIAASRASKPG